MIYVLIPYRHQMGRSLDARDVVRRHYEHVFPDAVVALCNDPEPGPFNRGRALNAGVADSYTRDTDVLVFADADVLVPADQLDAAVRTVSAPAAPSFVVPFDRVFMADETSSARLTNLATIAGPTVNLDVDMTGETFDRLSTGGVNVLLRSSFARCGGFDPRFHGWGFEDAAFEPAMRTLVGPPSWITGRAVHLWHPPTRDPGTAHHAASLALCRRYEAAHGDRVAMEALIREHALPAIAENLARYKRETG